MNNCSICGLPTKSTKEHGVAVRHATCHDKLVNEITKKRLQETKQDDKKK